MTDYSDWMIEFQSVSLRDLLVLGAHHTNAQLLKVRRGRGRRRDRVGKPRAEKAEDREVLPRGEVKERGQGERPRGRGQKSRAESQRVEGKEGKLTSQGQV
jgi:hypothetical protein